ncbi:hypothetical protein F4810DRAFT_660700 [Camillea tinctor]|nr:hypothetical protein F4810DRAFT_660700 [Camillea tinctor]
MFSAPPFFPWFTISLVLLIAAALHPSPHRRHHCHHYPRKVPCIKADEEKENQIKSSTATATSLGTRTHATRAKARDNGRNEGSKKHVFWPLA